MRDVAHEIEDLFYRQPFRIPAQFAFAGRAIGTLSGLATGLAPEFNLVAVAMPYAQKFLGLDRGGAAQSAQQLLQQVLDAGRTLLTLPATLDRVLALAEAGELAVHVADDSGGRGRGRRRSRTGSGGGLALFGLGAAAFAAGTLLQMQQLPIAGWFCLALAGVAVVGSLLRR